MWALADQSTADVETAFWSLLAMEYHSTRQAATTIGVTPNALNRAIWEGRVNAPVKSPSGAYLWTERDIEHASWVLRHRAPSTKGARNATTSS
jgi:hypothetical protein